MVYCIILSTLPQRNHTSTQIISRTRRFAHASMPLYWLEDRSQRWLITCLVSRTSSNSKHAEPLGCDHGSMLRSWLEESQHGIHIPIASHRPKCSPDVYHLVDMMCQRQPHYSQFGPPPLRVQNGVGGSESGSTHARNRDKKFGEFSTGMRKGRGLSRVPTRAE